MTTDQRKPFAPTTEAEHERRWILWFDDDLHPHEHFSGEGAEQAAHLRHEQASQHWCCTLFSTDAASASNKEWALKQARALAQAHGFCVVPMEPTPEMWRAAWDEIPQGSTNYNVRRTWVAQYKAAIAAAATGEGK